MSQHSLAVRYTLKMCLNTIPDSLVHNLQQRSKSGGGCVLDHFALVSETPGPRGHQPGGFKSVLLISPAICMLTVKHHLTWQYVVYHDKYLRDCVLLVAGSACAICCVIH